MSGYLHDLVKKTVLDLAQSRIRAGTIHTLLQIRRVRDRHEVLPPVPDLCSSQLPPSFVAKVLKRPCCDTVSVVLDPVDHLALLFVSLRHATRAMVRRC